MTCYITLCRSPERDGDVAKFFPYEEQASVVAAPAPVETAPAVEVAAPAVEAAKPAVEQAAGVVTAHASRRLDMGTFLVRRPD